jgi:GT2 family glycosyltransferase
MMSQIEQPLVYAVILTWNQQQDTLECLASLLGTEYPNLKILVVDNGSTDGTEKSIRTSFPDVELIINKENLGFVGGNNMGIESALQRDADYVLILNNDTVVAKDLVRRLVTVAESDGQIGVVTPRIYFHDDKTRIWSAGGARPVFMPGIKMIGHGKKNGLAYAQQRDVEFATGCAMLVKAEVFRQVGLFDPAYFIYHEDYDLSERVRGAGYRIVYAPEAKVWHREPLSRRNISPRKWYRLAESTVTSCVRYRRFPYLVLTVYVGWLIVRECFKGNAKVARPCFRGMRDGLSRIDRT